MSSFVWRDHDAETAAARRCSHVPPRPPQTPSVAGGTRLDLLAGKRCPPAAAALASHRSNSARSALAQPCHLRCRHDRRISRRRFPARSAGLRGVGDRNGPVPAAGTLSAGDSVRVRRRNLTPVRPRLALPPPPPPRSSDLPETLAGEIGRSPRLRGRTSTGSGGGDTRRPAAGPAFGGAARSWSVLVQPCRPRSALPAPAPPRHPALLASPSGASATARARGRP